MTRNISLVTAVVGAALVLGVPAAWGDSWFNDQQQASVRVSPDVVDRAVAAKQKSLSSVPDARHSSLVTRQRALEAREEPFDARGDALNRQYGLGKYAVSTETTAPNQLVDARSDGLNRLYGLGKYQTPVGDFDRFRIDHSNVPVPVSVTSSGREIDWPQIGIGFGVGMIIVMGLILALKATHSRPFAH